MDTVNIVLMMILCTIIGISIGNAWGKETMKRTMTGLLDQMIRGAQTAAEKGRNTGTDGQKED